MIWLKPFFIYANLNVPKHYMDETIDSQRAPLKSQIIPKISAYVPLIQYLYLYLYESFIYLAYDFF